MSVASAVAAMDERGLVALVSDVTAAICGIKFSLSTPSAAESWIAASLAIKGGSSVTVSLSSDERSSRAIAAGMLQMSPADLDKPLIEDTLREILNMVAGKVKHALSLDQALGLPIMVAPSELHQNLGRGSRCIGLASGPLKLVLVIAAGP